MNRNESIFSGNLSIRNQNTIVYKIKTELECRLFLFLQSKSTFSSKHSLRSLTKSILNQWTLDKLRSNPQFKLFLHQEFPQDTQIPIQTRFSTGNSMIDDYLSLNDLIVPGKGDILELAGQSGSGKSQFLLQIMVHSLHIQLNHTKALCFVSDAASMSTLKLNQWSKELKNDSISNRILVKVVYTVNEILEIIKSKSFEKFIQRNQIKVLVIDNVASLFQEENGIGVGNRIDLVNELKYLSRRYALMVVVVNQMITAVQNYQRNLSHQSVQKPALGKTWNSMMNSRIVFSKHVVSDSESRRFLTLQKSNHVFAPKHQLEFIITDSGISSPTPSS